MIKKDEEQKLIRLVEVKGICTSIPCEGCPLYLPGNNEFNCMTDYDSLTYILAKEMLFNRYPSSYFDIFL